MKKPLISILIPCYNGDKYVDQCLNSVVNQSYSELEILIINDGSTDDSLMLLQKWQKKDARIKVLSQMNLGLSLSRNYLINISSGVYFSLLDIDDTLPVKSIENLYKSSYEGKADVVVGRTNGVYSNGQIKIPYFPLWRRRKNMTNLQYVKSNICTPWSSIIRKEYFINLDSFFIPGRVFEDIGIMPYVYLKAEVFVAINELTYNYHKYNDSTNKISNFKEKSFVKRNDLLIQTNNLFNKFKLEGWECKRDFKKAINGVLYQILMLNNILLNNFTNEVKIKRLLKYNTYKMLVNFGWKLKFSKTPWKTISYIYLRISYIKFFKHGIVFRKTFQGNYIMEDETLINLKKNTKYFKVFKFNKNDMNKKNMKNLILEIDENHFIESHKTINDWKLKYIFIKSNGNNLSNFSKFLDYQNIYGITVQSQFFDSIFMRENENFLIVNIDYIHTDEFSFKKLINQLNQLNHMSRRPLIFLKCKWNRSLVKDTKSLVDHFIFVDEYKIKAKTINDKALTVRK
ncbi:MAG: glycosyltransferase family 2 protein [Mycoplasmataceae bacterium]|nr:glycosyltransferase family 2 protein [Mycoplasmataceae bacterium]